jgi:hypothetical protein
MRWVAAVAFALLAAGALAQPRYGLAPEISAVFERWVMATCVGDEERELAAQLRRYAVQLEPAFRKAIVDGPPPAELREVRAAAEERFAARQRFPIQDYKVEGVSEKDLAAFRRVPRQAYVDDQVRRFATGYRANAIAGLGIIGSPGARQTLARLAANRDDPLSLAAREAIKAADQR